MITPTKQFYNAEPKTPRKVARGIDKRVDWLHGVVKRRKRLLRVLSREADASLRILEKELKLLPQKEFESRLRDSSRRFKRGDHSKRSVREAFACLSRVAHDVLGLTPYREQIIGAMAVQRGLFAEMATGEGKTLTIGLAATLAGWIGRPCHIVTANDYLAKRDSETLAAFYEFCGVQVGHVVAEMTPDERTAQYCKEVIYTTSQEILADFLRDRLKLGFDQTPQCRLIRHLSHSGNSTSQGGLLQRGIHTVIIDEADNILIDEAVTPLIISRKMPGNSLELCCTIARDLALMLKSGDDYDVDFAYGEIKLKNRGKSAIARHSHRLPAIWRSQDRRNELVRQALVARHFFERDTHYVITAENKVEIVDELTGRIMPGRTWKQGLHQAIEAKEEIAITDPTETQASMSFQRFFRMFHSIAGVSGTARESSSELWRVYRLPVVSIPTHRPLVRVEEPPKVFATKEKKYEAVIEEIERFNGEGKPVLVGSRTVAVSEELSEKLTEKGLPHSVLNAVRHEEEAAIVEKAGEKGQITIATNMAGRGTDIRLSEEVLSLGGLHVIAVEYNLSPRIDRQLIGRAGRQGEPGSARYFMSVEDELLVRFMRPARRKRMKSLLELGAPGSYSMAISASQRSQRTAAKLGEKQREAVLRMDTWLEEHLSFTRRSSG